MEDKMYTVTERIARIKQPYGGYIRMRDFRRIQLSDNGVLSETMNINAGLIGLSVDYLTRLMMGSTVEQAFDISIRGARIAKEDDNAKELLGRITGLNQESVFAACKLAGYDVCYRVGAFWYKPVSEINPNECTVENIILMVKRSVEFWKEYGPIVQDGFSFYGGYTPVITSGDGDFLTKDTLWDFKVIKREPTSKHTLQLLVYYIMGKHSRNEHFDSIEYLGIFNPRKNKVYRYPVKAIPDEIIKTVSHDVIGYGWSVEEYIALYKERYGPRLGLARIERNPELRKLLLNK